VDVFNLSCNWCDTVLRLEIHVSRRLGALGEAHRVGDTSRYVGSKFKCFSSCKVFRQGAGTACDQVILRHVSIETSRAKIKFDLHAYKLSAFECCEVAGLKLTILDLGPGGWLRSTRPTLIAVWICKMLGTQNCRYCVKAWFRYTG